LVVQKSPQMRRPFTSFAVLAVAATALCSGLIRCGHADVALAAEPNREYAVKAAFIYNFAQFTQWPAEAFPAADSPLTIGVIGDSNGPLETAVQQIAGKAVGTHAIAIKHVSGPGDAARCQLLVVSPNADEQLDEIFKQVADKPVLTVGESDKFPWAGGCIRFVTEDNKVRFEINPDAADRAHLRISSKLMKLARIFKR